MGKNKEKIMQTKKKNAEKHVGHGFSQFELTNYLLNNLSQFNISPSAKLILLELSTYYNPKNADIFPKQKTLAKKIGISERSITRGISELVKAGLIMVECKYTNRYKIVARMDGKRAENEKIFTADTMSGDLSQNCTKQIDKLASHDSNKQDEQKKEPTSVEDFKILKNYAVKMGAKNVKRYIEVLQENGAAKKIIKDFKEKQAIQRYNDRVAKETSEKVKLFEQEKLCAEPPTQSWKNLRATLFRQ